MSEPCYLMEYTAGVWKAPKGRVQADWVAIYRRGVADPVEQYELPHDSERTYNPAAALESLGWRLTSGLKYTPGGPGTTSRASVERI